MKKIYQVFLLGFLLGPMMGWGQTTLYSENFGTTGTLPTGWTSSNTTNGWNGSTLSASSGYTGASAGANALFVGTGTNGAVHTLTYANSLSTAGYTSITVLWGGRGTTTFTGAITFQWSSDGATWNNVTYSYTANGNIWALVNSGARISLPVGAEGLTNLRFRFSAASTNSGNYRIDDFSVQGNSGINYYWNGSNATPLNDTWDNTATNWTTPTATAAPNAAWPSAAGSNIANFLTGSGTVTLPGPIAIAPTNTIIGNSSFNFTAITAAALTSTIALGANTLTLAPATGGSITLTGIISGTGGGITQNGAGTTTLSGVNTFTGSKVLTTGSLNINNTAALGTSAGTFTINGGTIDNTSVGAITTANFPQSWAGDFTFTGSNALNLGTGLVGLTANRQVTVTANTLTEAGIISGAFSLTKAGAGTLELSGANTYSGGTVVAAGSLTLGAAGVLADAGTVTLNGGNLNSGAFSETMGVLNVTANSSITLANANHTLTFANSSASAGTGNLTINGWMGAAGASGTNGKIVVGVGGLTAAQLGRITFNGYTGAAIILAGEVIPASTTPAITPSVATLTGFTYVQNNGPSTLQSFTVTAANLTAGGGTITFTGNTNYDVSTDGTTFGNTATLTYTGTGALALNTVSVRLRVGLSVATYNSQAITVAGGGVSSTTIVTVSGSVTASAASNIIEDGDAAFYDPNTVNIPYTTWQSASILNTGNAANGSLGVFRFRMQDGGGVSDADGLPTIVNGITFAYTGTGNTIRTASIFNGNTRIVDVTTVNANSLVFSGLVNSIFTVTDNGSQVLTLRVTFSTTVTDNQKLQYSVSLATTATSASSSQFTTISAVSDGGLNDRNRIEVTADRLRFVQQPSNTAVTAAMSPSVTVAGADVNGNVDLDYTGSTIQIISTGTLTDSPVGATVSAGTATFSTLTHTVSQTGRILTATTTGLAASNTIASSTFEITSEPANSYRTIADGNWHSTTASGSALTWQQLIAGTWTAISNSPPANTTNNVYIKHLITLIGSNTASNIIIENGGILSTSTINTTFTNLLVKTGGRFNKEGNGVGFNLSGIFEVENGATFTFRHTNTTSRSTSIWNGIEKFHPNSNFEILTTDNASGFLPIQLNADVSEYDNAGYLACFGNIIINNSAGQMQLLPIDFVKNLTHGNLIFRINSSNINFCNGAFSTTIGGNIIIESTFSNSIAILSSQSTASVTVKGNFVHNGTGEFRLANSQISNAVNVTLNVEGDLTIGASILSMDIGTSFSANVNLNLKGDISIAATGLLTTSNSNKNAVFNFNGSGDGLTAATTQTISIASAGATRNQNIKFTVNNLTYVQLINQNLELGSSSNLTVATGGVFDFGFNSAGTTALNLTESISTAVTSFVMLTGSKIKITNPNGIDATSTAALDGNVQTDTRTYSETGIYHYIGKAPQQRVGDGIVFGGISGKYVIVELDALTTKLVLQGNSLASTTTFIGLVDIGLSSTGSGLKIIQGTVVGTATSDFMSTGNIEMTGGLYQIAYPYGTTAIVPRLSGTYSLTGGTIELNGTNDQKLRGGNSPNTPNYFNLKMSGSNTVTINNTPIVVVNNLDISNTAIFDIENNNMSGAATFTMTDADLGEGGRLRTSALVPTATQPGLTGIYSLTYGVVEFKGSNISTKQSIRNSSSNYQYKNIEVTGSNVGHSTGNTTLNAGGSFTVKSTGVFEITDNAIVGVGTAESVIVEDGGLFKCANALGFNGPVVGLNSPSIRAGGADNIETITLNAGSTVEYSRADPATPVNQTITRVISGGSEIAYQNISFTGTSTVGSIKTAPSTTLTVQGNMTKSGNSVFAHNGATVLFNNTTAIQTFTNSGTTDFNFYNLTNSNTFSTGLNINGDMGVANGLTLTANAKLNLLAGSITMLSDNTRTAYVNTIPATAAISYGGTGKFSIQRYLPIPLTAAARRWRLLTAPIQITGAPNINTAWQEGQANANRLSPSDTKPGFGTIITKSITAASGYDQGSTNNASIFKFEGSNIIPWQTIAATNTGAITDQEGYMIFVRGNRNFIVAGAGVAGAPTTLRSTGLINTGNVSKLLDPLYPKLIGNPYPSAISFNKVTVNGQNPATTSGITFYLWDPKYAGLSNVGGIITFTSLGTGFYTVAPDAIGSNYTTGIYDGTIESGAAFLMPASAGSIDFTEASKIQTSSTQGIASRPSGPQEPVQKTAFFTTNLLACNAADAVLIDGVVNVCRDDFENKADDKDGPKLITFQIAEKLTLLRDEKLLGIELRKSFEHNDSIVYQISKMKQANYQLAFIQTGFTNDLKAIAEDKFTGKKLLLSSSDTSLLAFTITDNPASAAADRFKVVFKSAVKFNAIKATGINADVQVEWDLENEFDADRYEVERSLDGNSFTTVGSIVSKGNSMDAIAYSTLDNKPAPGIYYYRIKGISNNGAIAYSETVKVVMMNTNAGLYVYPNPVSNGSIGLQMNSTPAGVYSLRLLNSAGQTIVAKTVTHAGGTASVNINYPAQLTGHYQLEITGANKKKTVLKVLIQ